MGRKRIVVVCYDAIEKWCSRKRAMKFYLDGASFCDGCESERYFNIYSDLMDGCGICHDGYSERLDILTEQDRFRQFPNGTNVRDLNRKVEYPTGMYGSLK